jgi:hypothetical protein
MACGELKGALRAGQNGRQHVKRSFCSLAGAGFRSCVDNETKIALREGKVADVTWDKGDVGIRGEMGNLGWEGLGGAREHSGPSVEGKAAINMTKRFKQPTTEEASAAGDENLLVPHLVPKRHGLFEYVIEVDDG